VDDGRELLVEELGLVDADDLCLGQHGVEQRARAAGVVGPDLHLAVRRDVVAAEAVVDRRLEDLHLLLRDLRAPQAADQLLALAAEHRAGNDLDPSATIALRDFHQALPRYSPDSVFTRMTSPTLTNEGTLTTRPVSSVAGLICARAVAPSMPGGR